MVALAYLAKWERRMRKDIQVVALAVLVALVSHWLLASWLEIPFFLYWLILVVIGVKFDGFRPYFFTFVFFPTYLAISFYQKELDFREGFRTALCFAGGIAISYFATSVRQALLEVEIARRRFTQFMQFLPGLAWIKDSEGRYIYVNDAAEKAFGKPKEELYGRTDDQLFPLETAAHFKANDQEAFRQKTGIQIIETLEQADGIHYSVVNKFPIPGEDDQLFVGGMTVDITEQKRAEEMLRHHLVQLEQSDRLKDEFLATLAHELRNPLAPIASGLLVIKAHKINNPILNSVNEMMERQVNILVRLIDDLLDVSRISRGRIELRKEACDLNLVIRDAVESVQPFADANRHEITVSLPGSPLYLMADHARLSQIAINLMNNSIKYTKPGGKIELTVLKEGEKAIIVVKDNGIGIPSDKLCSIFDLFYQIDRTTARSQTGLGIGLTLVKKLVEMHGGTAAAYSEGPGTGSTFTVTIPIEEVKGLPIPQMDAESEQEVRVLIVDDNIDAAKSLAMLLKLSGYEAETVHDGLTALDMIDHYRPNVIIQDIGMPVMDGYEITRRVRQRYSSSQIKIVALTGFGKEEDRQKTRAGGFDYHLVKPVNYRELQQVLAGEYHG